MATIRVDLALFLFSSLRICTLHCSSRSVCVCVLVVRILYFHRLVIGAVGDSNKTISGSKRRRRADFLLIFLLNVSRCTPRLVSIPRSNRVK